MTTKAARVSIAPCLSVLLDLTRIMLSVTVAIGHWTQSFFQDTSLDLTRYATVAVGVFFVLSGFTIRMIYPARKGFAFAAYVAERWSRILSVTVPALLLTVVLDGISWHTNPTYYIGNWPELLDHPLRRLLVNLVGVSQVWGQDVAPLSNSPFWSISYELGFYLVYGLWLSGRRLLAACSLLLLGPQIALLLPVWLLGVVVYDLCCARAPGQGVQHRALIALMPAAGGLVAAGAVALCGEWARTALIGASGMDLHRVSLTLLLGALSFFPVFIVAALLSERLAVYPSARSRAIARWLGNLTFPIYLFHFPMFVFISALHLYDRHSVLQRSLAFSMVLAVTAALAPATDHLKVWLRSALAPRASNTHADSVHTAVAQER